MMNDESSLSVAEDNASLSRRMSELIRANEALCTELAASNEVVRVLQQRLINASIGLKADREFRRAALNLMEDAIQAQIAEQRENVERRRVEAELRDADRRKDEFLATLAHELRNPLAPIRNSLSILRLAGADNAVQERLHEMMERQVNHMIRLVDDLMEVSRITRGKVELKKEKVELATVIGSAIETSRPLLESGRHNLAVSLPGEPIMLFADPVRLAQVVANLLNNAAKYTDVEGQIWLEASHNESHAIIKVRDSGIGIPPEMLPRVFEIFTQVDYTLGRAQGGLGIGLSLVRSLIEMHGGKVEAYSEGPGQGSEFIVTLPLCPPEAPISAVHSSDKSSQSTIPRRILVVDDNEDAANSMGVLLKYLGADVCVASDGQSAIDAVHNYRPSIMLLDIGMPGMDGYEVARRLRDEPDGREMTLIALTGWGQEEDRRRTKEAGFDHHLVKPADLTALRELLSPVWEDDHPLPRTPK